MSEWPDPVPPREAQERMRTGCLVVIAACLLGIVLALLVERAWGAEPNIVAVDGDTIYVGEEKVRIIGMDAPETYQARCESERLRGHRATAYLRSLLESGAVTVRRQGRDRYGRTLAHVYVDGRDVARLMIEAGHAVPYHCPGGRCPRRIDWCAGAG
jgi:Micrococcal nuclease (thermonuclease) homologs